jgi:hypothetical protein
MSTTAPTKRTATAKRTTATVETVAETVAESPLSIIRGLAAAPTAEHVATMRTIVATADDALRLATFHGRVETSAMVGYTMVAEATVLLGIAPDGFAKAAEACGVTHKNGVQYLDRKFSTLEECYRIASHHTAERLESFVSAFAEAHGKNPESVRAYSVWVNADAKGGKRAASNTVETLKARKAAAAKAKAAAETTAKVKAAKRVGLVKAKAAAKADGLVIAGCPLTRDQWEAMTIETLEAVAILAETMRAAKAKAAKAAGDAETVSTVAAETGPTPRRAARTKVAA